MQPNSKHPPCIVILAHPLLCGTEIARNITNVTQSRFVQSSGTPTNGRPVPLADTLFEFLLCQAGAFQHDMYINERLNLEMVANQRIIEDASFRCEQIAARANLTDRGFHVNNAHTYLSMCTRNSLFTKDTIEAATIAHIYDTYDDVDYTNTNHSAQETLSIKLKMSPALADQEHALKTSRYWNLDGSEEQIEIFVGDHRLDTSLLGAISANRSVVAQTLMRTESLLRSQIYDTKNTLYVVVDVSDNYTKIALACIHQWICNEFRDIDVRVRCDVMTRLASAINGTWSLLKSSIENDATKHMRVLSVSFNDNPPVGQHIAHAPSRVFEHQYIGDIVCNVLLGPLDDMIRQVGRKTHTTDLCTIDGTHGRLQSRISFVRLTRVYVDVTSVTLFDDIEDIGTAFERLFKLRYQDGEFALELESRPASSINHSQYEQIGDNSLPREKQDEDAFGFFNVAN